MKKKLQIIGVVSIVSLFLLASCKTHAKCPAYSKSNAKTEQTNA